MNFGIQAINPNVIAGANGVPIADAGLQNQESAGTILQDFAKMLIVQITNQDPNNPMDPTAMIAQFAQVQTSMGMAKLSEELNYYSLLQTGMQTVGKNVIMRDPKKQNVLYTGTVKGVDFTGPTPAVKLGHGTVTTLLDGVEPRQEPLTDEVLPLKWLDGVETE